MPSLSQSRGSPLRFAVAEASGGAVAAAPLVAPDPSAVWQWLKDNDEDDDDDFAPYAEEEAVVEGCWVSYTPEETARLEAAYAAGQKTVDIQGRWYVFLQEPMQQQPIDSRCTNAAGGSGGSDGSGGRLSQTPRAVRRKAAAQVEISAAAAAEAQAALVLSSGSAGGSSAERLLPGWGNFLEHVVSRIWCTYREGFSPVGPPIYTSDAGWGCMLRTAQMMLAQSLVRLELGDQWLLPSSAALPPPPPPPSSESTAAADDDGMIGSPPVAVSAPSGSAEDGGEADDDEDDVTELTASSALEAEAVLSPYRRLLRLFGDEKEAGCPYSLQYMVQVGGEFGMSTGQWYGPSLAARVLERLVNSHPEAAAAAAAAAHGAAAAAAAAAAGEGGGDGAAAAAAEGELRVWVATDSMGTIYKDAIQACAAGHPPASSTTPGAEPEPEPEPELDPAGGGGGGGWRHPVLLLLPLKLGLDRYIHPRYTPALAAVFRLPQSVGFIGGSPSSSYYFIAAQTETEQPQPSSAGGFAGGGGGAGTAAAAAAAGGGGGAEAGGAAGGGGGVGAKTTVVYLDPHSVQPTVRFVR